MLCLSGAASGSGRVLTCGLSEFLAMHQYDLQHQQLTAKGHADSFPVHSLLFHNTGTKIERKHIKGFNEYEGPSLVITDHG